MYGVYENERKMKRRENVAKAENEEET